MNTKNSLNTPVFQDELDFKTLENILEALDHVTPKKISRQEYNIMNGNFLVETGEDRFGKQYDLFLPEDLKVYELPAIISRINKITFGEILPDYASKEELKLKIIITLNALFDVLDQNKDTILVHRIHRAIKKYIQLFEEVYGLTEAKKLGNKNFRNEMIEDSKKNLGYKNYIEYKTKLENIKTKERLGNLLEEIEGNVSSEIQKHFQESFFERGINMIRLGMMTITQEEQNNLKPNENQIGEVVSFHTSNEKLDKKERFLREKIGIDKLKNDLKSARLSGNKEKIQEMELKASNKIIEILYEYPYQLTQNEYGYQPNKIAKFKEIQCVGFSLLGHAFLTELGIEHFGLNHTEHSSLAVRIGEKNYYFDATASNQVHEFSYGEKKGAFHKIILKNSKFNGNDVFVQKGDPEKILLSHIYNNRGVNLQKLGKYKESMKLFDKAIELNPEYDSSINNKGKALYYLGKYEEALTLYEEALLLNNSFGKHYNNKGNVLYALGHYKEALEMYKNGYKLDYNLPKDYIRIGVCLEKNGENEEALKNFNKAIQKTPSDAQSYHWKGYILFKHFNVQIGKLYIFTSKILKGESEIFDITYRKEKNQIRKLIEDKNFEGLRLYLLELEKQDK